MKLDKFLEMVREGLDLKNLKEADRAEMSLEMEPPREKQETPTITDS